MKRFEEMWSARVGTRVGQKWQRFIARHLPPAAVHPKATRLKSGAISTTGKRRG